MKKYLALFLITVSGIFANGQVPQNTGISISSKTEGAVSPSADSAILDLAKLTVKAHGGEKFTNMKTLVVRGMADVSATPSQVIPASFAFVYSGEKYRIDINNPFQPLKQVFDGEQTFSSINGFSLPPLNRLGMPLLQKLETTGFILSALPENLKKKKGFRITSPEGYFTDFFIDEKTGLVKSYEASYDLNGRSVSTSVEIDKMRDVDGVILPEKYSQRFNLGTMTIYSSFKAKDILVNSDVSDNVFTMNK